VPLLVGGVPAPAVIPPAHTVAGAAALAHAADAALELSAAADRAAHSCVMTHVALLAHRLTGSVPLLGLLIFVGKIAFLAIVTLSACYEGCRDKAGTYLEDDDSTDDIGSPSHATSPSAITASSHSINVTGDEDGNV
jgi:hypothetical protein